MKSIAIVFSGQLRTFKKCFTLFNNNILNILKNDYYVDIYCHIWDYEKKEDIEEVINLYKPIQYIITESINYKLPDFCQGLYFHECNNFPYDKVYGHTNQKYGIYKGFELVKINKKIYDFVMRCRYDCLFESVIPLNELKNMEEKSIYVGNGHTKYLNNYQTNINDAFAVGFYKDMEKYFTFYNNITLILKDIKNKNIPKKYNYLFNCIGFSLLYKFYLDHYCNLNFSISKMKFCLLRENGEQIYFSDCIYTYKGINYIHNGGVL